MSFGVNMPELVHRGAGEKDCFRIKILWFVEVQDVSISDEQHQSRDDINTDDKTSNEPNLQHCDDKITQESQINWR